MSAQVWILFRFMRGQEGNIHKCKAHNYISILVCNAYRIIFASVPDDEFVLDTFESLNQS